MEDLDRRSDLLIANAFCIPLGTNRLEIVDTA
jgi:hypothetical protein